MRRLFSINRHGDSGNEEHWMEIDGLPDSDVLEEQHVSLRMLIYSSDRNREKTAKDVTWSDSLNVSLFVCYVKWIKDRCVLMMPNQSMGKIHSYSPWSSELSLLQLHSEEKKTCETMRDDDRHCEEKKFKVAASSFDLPTSELWAQHASTAPRCWHTREQKENPDTFAIHRHDIRSRCPLVGIDVYSMFWRFWRWNERRNGTAFYWDLIKKRYLHTHWEKDGIEKLRISDTPLHVMGRRNKPNAITDIVQIKRQFPWQWAFFEIDRYLSLSFGPFVEIADLLLITIDDQFDL